MILDPERRGRELAEFFAVVSPRLWADLEASGLLPPVLPSRTPERARDEWECFALYACVRGLVAAGGFNRETARAIDAMHQAVLERWTTEAASAGDFGARREILAARHGEYGSLGQQGGAAGVATLSLRLGEAAARHMIGTEPSGDLAQLVGGLHEALTEGVAEAVRRAE